MRCFWFTFEQMKKRFYQALRIIINSGIVAARLSISISATHQIPSINVEKHINFILSFLAAVEMCSQKCTIVVVAVRVRVRFTEISIHFASERGHGCGRAECVRMSVNDFVIKIHATCAFRHVLILTRSPLAQPRTTSGSKRMLQIRKIPFDIFPSRMIFHTTEFVLCSFCVFGAAVANAASCQ